MSNRFHSKFHRQNHHSQRTAYNENYVDAAYDPIASYDAPFEGEFYSRGEIVTTQHLSARNYVYAEDGVIHNNFFIGNDLTLTRDLSVGRNAVITNNLEVGGNLNVLGTVSQLDTYVTISSATEITNYGTGPALKITQHGMEPIAHFIDVNGDDIIFQDNGFVGLGTDNPNEKLTVVGNISGNSDLYIEKDLNVSDGVFFVDHSKKFVGVNTTEPNVDLTVVGSISSSEDLTVVNNTTLGTKPNANYVDVNGRLELLASTNQTAIQAKQSGSGNILLLQNNSNYPFVVNNQGRVGVGTTNPNTNLTVIGNISATQYCFANHIRAHETFNAKDINVSGNTTFQNSLSVSGVINIDDVTFTDETTVATSITADNLFLKLFIGGQPKYLRLFDVI